MVDEEADGIGREGSGEHPTRHQDPTAGDAPHPSSPVGRKGSPLTVPTGTNSAAMIGGRMYSGHALDEMQSDGITPTVVEDAIARGAVRRGPTTIVYHGADNNISVVVGNATDAVVTVTRGEIRRAR